MGQEKLLLARIQEDCIMYSYDPKTGEITVTMSVSWEGTISRCWDFYHHAADDETGSNIIPAASELEPAQVAAVMEEVTDALNYSEPDSWNGVLSVIDEAVVSFIEYEYEGAEEALKAADAENTWTDEADSI